MGTSHVDFDLRLFLFFYTLKYFKKFISKIK